MAVCRRYPSPTHRCSACDCFTKVGFGLVAKLLAEMLCFVQKVFSSTTIGHPIGESCRNLLEKSRRCPSIVPKRLNRDSERGRVRVCEYPGTPRYRVDLPGYPGTRASVQDPMFKCL
eukprot:1762307-Rhodomonas_salina.1